MASPIMESLLNTMNDPVIPLLTATRKPTSMMITASDMGCFFVAEVFVYFRQRLKAFTISQVIHDHRLTAFWIPHSRAYTAFLGPEGGRPAAAFQPNYFFEEMDPARIADAAGIARSYGMGIEVEFDEHAETDPALRERLLAYLRGGSRYGYQDGFVAYYQGVDALYRYSTSTDPEVRELYDLVADFVVGKKIE
jgi:hypothetical protein